MVLMMTKQPIDIDIELFELMFPGKLIGKAVIDANARMIGVIRNIRIQIPSPTISLTVKGLDTEFTVKSEDIQAIGNVVQLNVIIKHSEPVEINDIIKLRNEIQEELIHFFSLLK
jgi:sporulation protein YlmC with PRC-barrel domain